MANIFSQRAIFPKTFLLRGTKKSRLLYRGSSFLEETNMGLGEERECQLSHPEEQLIHTVITEATQVSLPVF